MRTVVLDETLWNRIHGEKDSQMYIAPNVCLSAEANKDFVLVDHKKPMIKVFKAKDNAHIQMHWYGYDILEEE